MGVEDVIILAGDVIEVQLTSETLLADDDADGASRITKRMRVFVRDAAGAEKSYDFEDADVGIRAGHRVVIVRTRGKHPENLMLFDISTDQRAAFEPGLHTLLARKPPIPPFVRAAGFALLCGALLYLVSHFITDPGDKDNGATASGFAILMFPLLWWLITLWDKARAKRRYVAAREAFIADMAARAPAYAKSAPAP